MEYSNPVATAEVRRTPARVLSRILVVRDQVSTRHNIRIIAASKIRPAHWRNIMWEAVPWLAQKNVDLASWEVAR